jgi:UDP-2,3-diacylglucosamine pyrophosphatase LpxH
MQGLLLPPGLEPGRTSARPVRRRTEPAPPRGPRRGGGSARPRYRAVWISDVHLGTRGCQSALLLEFLREVQSEDLYLVGDIVDGWALRKSWYWNEDHNRILETILEKSSRGTRVHFVCGNHDEFLRPYAGLLLGGIELMDEAVHVTARGKRLLVMHGDRFDVCIRNARWLAHLGDRAYRVCLAFNTWFNRARRRMGYGYWSLSAFLKQRVKNAVSFIASFETAALEEARRRGFDGVVCGHIHKAELRTVDGSLYCNDGDWVESCTALVEDHAGRLRILDWTRVREARASRARGA